MNELEVNQFIQFQDWNGVSYAGRIKDVLNLSDDFGEFYLVWLETPHGDSRFEVEDLNGFLIGDRWGDALHQD